MVSGNLGRQVGPGMAVPGAFVCQVGSETAVSGPLDVKLALDGVGDKFQVGSAVSLKYFGLLRPVNRPKSSVEVYV